MSPQTSAKQTPPVLRSPAVTALFLRCELIDQHRQREGQKKEEKLGDGPTLNVGMGDVASLFASTWTGRMGPEHGRVSTVLSPQRDSTDDFMTDTNDSERTTTRRVSEASLREPGITRCFHLSEGLFLRRHDRS